MICVFIFLRVCYLCVIANDNVEFALDVSSLCF